MGRPEYTPADFWRKVDKNGPVPPHRPELGPCWIWNGVRGKKGYGRFTMGKKYSAAHRFAYEEIKGPIPIGKCLNHQCDNPPCVNPDHFFIGTRADNVADMVAKGRNAKGATLSKALCKVSLKGSTNPASKLTEQQVLEIRQLCATPGIYMCQIAKRFNVSESTIQHIFHRTVWKHI